MEATPTVAPTLRVRLLALRRSETASAAALAAATVAQQLLAVLFTVVFTRVLGTAGYGSLGALINFTVILLVPGSALQVAAARQGTLGRLGDGGELAATLRRWTRHLLLGLGALAVLSALAREPLAGLVNVDQAWAAAAVPVTAGLWLLVCLQRGLLQSARAYRAVAGSVALEGLGRMAGALVLVALGLGVTGAFLGALAAYACVALSLDRVLRRRLGPPAASAPHPLRALARTAAVPIAGLVLVAALQNVDVIMARRALDADAAGVYAATTVAAKFIVWVAVGVGLWVLPEATRRVADGRDPRPVLWRGLGVIAVLAVPALAAFVLVPSLLLRIAFGADYASGDAILAPLGLAYALLAVVYVAVQFLLGLHRRAFAWALLAVAVAEPLLLAGASSLEAFAGRVLLVQAVGAVVILAIAARVRHADRARAETVA